MFECLHVGKPDKAIAAARHAVHLKPDDPGLIANLALALLIGAKLDEASAVIQQSLRIAPQDPISRNLRQAITDVQSGRRAQPNSIADLETK